MRVLAPIALPQRGHLMSGIDIRSPWPRTDGNPGKPAEQALAKPPYLSFGIGNITFIESSHLVPAPAMMLLLFLRRMLLAQ